MENQLKLQMMFMHQCTHPCSCISLQSPFKYNSIFLYFLQMACNVTKYRHHCGDCKRFLDGVRDSRSSVTVWVAMFKGIMQVGL